MVAAAAGDGGGGVAGDGDGDGEKKQLECNYGKDNGDEEQQHDMKNDQKDKLGGYRKEGQETLGYEHEQSAEKHDEQEKTVDEAFLAWRLSRPFSGSIIEPSFLPPPSRF